MRRYAPVRSFNVGRSRMATAPIPRPLFLRERMSAAWRLTGEGSGLLADYTLPISVWAFVVVKLRGAEKEQMPLRQLLVYRCYADPSPPTAEAVGRLSRKITGEVR